MTEQLVKRVVIAGGGTAGWTAAAALGKLLGPLLDITLVESEGIATVGVGESTVPTARTFHHLLGIDEAEFMRDNQSSFKLAISFENWARLGDRYIHSFGTLGKSTWMGDFQHVWLQAVAEGFGGEIGDYCLEFQAALAHKFTDADPYRMNYAYHLDAVLYARFLRRFSEGHGVKRVEGRIERVEQHPETGCIEALVLASGDRIEGDLFIDCTGFRSLLLGEALETPFEDWLHWLPTNSALPVQTRAVEPASPFTRAIAHDAGWLWKIPLQRRVGCGLVYASDFLTDAQAQDRLHAQIEGEVLRELPRIRFRAGRRLKAWNRNCIALGLAGGFVEPLESTSIHMIQVAVTRLVQSFPFNGCHEALVDRFNERSRDEIESIRDFIVLHYHVTERDDSEFWRYMRHMPVPESVTRRIALFRDDAQAYQAPDELFRIDSYVQVLLGQRVFPQGYHAMARLMPPEQLRDALHGLKTNIAKAVARMPGHQAFLERFAVDVETREPAVAGGARA